MCDDSFDAEQIEAMRRAYINLRAAAQRVLALCDDLGLEPARQALDGLAVACAVDPASFVIEPPPMHRMVLRLPPRVASTRDVGGHSEIGLTPTSSSGS